MPVFWLAVSDGVVDSNNLTPLGLIFLIIHVLVYPASNGYNSYFDKDEDSIGGVKNPPKVTKELFYLVILFDLLAISTSLLINWTFAAMVLMYLLVSKSYSYDKIRLKKYPVLSTLVVTIFQGAFVFFMVKAGVSEKNWFPNHLVEYILPSVATLFLVGSYPLTQIYQHEEDSKRGDKTISIVLGIKGTFVFSGIAFAFASLLFGWHCFERQQYIPLVCYLAASSVVLLFFNRWLIRSWKDSSFANFDNTMQMNKISSLSMSCAFIIICVYRYFSN